VYTRFHLDRNVTTIAAYSLCLLYSIRHRRVDTKTFVCHSTMDYTCAHSRTRRSPAGAAQLGGGAERSGAAAGSLNSLFASRWLVANGYTLQSLRWIEASLSMSLCSRRSSWPVAVSLQTAVHSAHSTLTGRPRCTPIAGLPVGDGLRSHCQSATDVACGKWTLLMSGLYL